MRRLSLALALALAATLSLGAGDSDPPVGHAVHAEKPADTAKPSDQTADVEQTPVERALAKRVKLDFKETLLKDVAKSLAEMSGVNVLLDERAITDMGASVDMPVTVENGNLISLREALRLMLGPLDMSFIPESENVLLITSATKAKDTVVTRTYEVRDLAVPQRNLDGTKLLFDELIDLITGVIAPTTWTDAGGTGSIGFFHTHLIVSQTHEIQEQIAILLDDMRQVRDNPRKYIESGQIVGASAEAKIAEMLTVEQDFDFHETTLNDLARFLRKQGIPVHLDVRALTDSGNSPESPVNFHAKHMRLDKALRMMLREQEFDYIIDHEVLVITSMTAAKDHVITRLYPVGDLAAKSPGDNAEDVSPYESLVNVVTSTVAPTTWADAGGTGAIQPYPALKILVCSQTQEIHEEIAKLLKMLRGHRGGNESAAESDVKSKEELVTRVYKLSFGAPEATGDYLAVVQKLIEPRLWTTGNNYLGKVPGAIIARCSPAVHSKIRELLVQLDALPPQGGKGGAGRLSGGLGGGGFGGGVPGSGAF